MALVACTVLALGCWAIQFAGVAQLQQSCDRLPAELAAFAAEHNHTSAAETFSIYAGYYSMVSYWRSWRVAIEHGCSAQHGTRRLPVTL